jgi:hypothetical protein
MGTVVSFPAAMSPFQCLPKLQVIDSELEKREPMTPGRSKALYLELATLEPFLSDVPSLTESYQSYFHEVDIQGTNYFVAQVVHCAKKVNLLLQAHNPRELIKLLSSAERLVAFLDHRGGLSGEQLKTVMYVKNYLNNVESFLHGQIAKAPPLALETISLPPEEVEMLLIEELYLIGEDYFLSHSQKAQKKINLLRPSAKEALFELAPLLNGRSFEEQSPMEKIQIVFAYAQQLALGEMEPHFLSKEDIEEIFLEGSEERAR